MVVDEHVCAENRALGKDCWIYVCEAAFVSHRSIARQRQLPRRAGLALAPRLGGYFPLLIIASV